MCLCMACLLSMTFLCVSVRPQSSVLWESSRKGHRPFFVNCDLSVLLMYECCDCFACYLKRVSILWIILSEKYVSEVFVSVVWGSVWYCPSLYSKSVYCSMWTHYTLSECICVNISMCVKVVLCKCFVFHTCVPDLSLFKCIGKYISFVFLSFTALFICIYVLQLGLG